MQFGISMSFSHFFFNLANAAAFSSGASPFHFRFFFKFTTFFVISPVLTAAAQSP
jgi:hypothetical protein